MAVAGSLAGLTLHPSSTAAAQTSTLAGVPHFMATVGSAAHAATAASGSGPLTYQTAAAPVESAPTLYLVFWGAQWQVGWSDISDSGAVYQSNTSKQYITDFFSYISGNATAWNGSQTQYCSGVAVGTVNCAGSGTHVGNPPAFGGTWVDTSSTPPPTVVPDSCVAVACLNPSGSVLDQANVLAQEAVNAEKHFLGNGYNPNANFVILLPKATLTPGYGYYCAYHSEAIDSNGHKIAFTNMPYVMDVNSLCGQNFVNASNNAYGNGYLDGYSIVLGHEVAEAETDPLPGTASAWRDSSGAETGDKCAWITPGTAGGSHNIGPDANGHVFAVQTLWSNTANGCV